MASDSRLQSTRRAAWRRWLRERIAAVFVGLGLGAVLAGVIEALRWLAP